jgi:hypothetical protein
MITEIEIIDIFDPENFTKFLSNLDKKIESEQIEYSDIYGQGIYKPLDDFIIKYMLNNQFKLEIEDKRIINRIKNILKPTIDHILDVSNLPSKIDLENSDVWFPTSDYKHLNSYNDYTYKMKKIIELTTEFLQSVIFKFNKVVNQNYETLFREIFDEVTDFVNLDFMMNIIGQTLVYLFIQHIEVSDKLTISIINDAYEKVSKKINFVKEESNNNNLSPSKMNSSSPENKSQLKDVKIKEQNIFDKLVESSGLIDVENIGDYISKITKSENNSESFLELLTIIPTEMFFDHEDNLIPLFLRNYDAQDYDDEDYDDGLQHGLIVNDSLEFVKIYIKHIPKLKTTRRNEKIRLMITNLGDLNSYIDDSTYLDLVEQLMSIRV